LFVKPTSARRFSWLALLALAALGLVVFYYFTGADSTLPVRVVPHLQPMPLALDSVAVGAGFLPVQVSGYVLSLTHDVTGPFVQPLAAALFVSLLGVLLAGWVAVVSTLKRTAFVAGMVPVIFLLLSLNTEELGAFNTYGRTSLYVLLAAIVGGGFVLHAFATSLSLGWRNAIMAGLVGAAGSALLLSSPLPAPEAALLLAAHGTWSAALLLAAVVLWVSIENIRALLWFNTQADQPQSRFGLLPFLLASLLYLGVLFLYVWNGNSLELFPGVGLDPLVLLLPALVAGWLGLAQRQPSYGAWVPYAGGMAQLYPLVVATAAGGLAYGLAALNTPFLVTAREITAQGLLIMGGVFLMYILVNFAPLIRQRLRVYKVVFEPRQLPFYSVYLLGIACIGVFQFNSGLTWLDQLQAARYNSLGDLARLQSEAEPDNLSLALLAERYYAESGDVLYRNNQPAQMGRAALYRFRNQRQNEINALNRALMRGANEKVTARLAAMYNDPQDLFDGLEVLRRGLKKQPQSAILANDLAQLFTRTSLTDSVALYLNKAEQLAPRSYAGRTNQLAFLLGQEQLAAARKLAAGITAAPDETALASNLALLALQTGQAVAPIEEGWMAQLRVLDEASFARLYHGALAGVRQHRSSLLPTLARLSAEPRNEPYYENLVFLQALTRHAVGEERQARQLLSPLTAGTSTTARYYQNLLGLWQLQQGQFATAAEQLDRAAVTDSVLRDAIRTLARRPAPAATSAQIGTTWLAQARQAEQQHNQQAAAKAYQRIAREAPFNEQALLAAADFYSRRKDYAAAYEALHDGLAENPGSIRLLQAYALSAADAGLSEYATDALARLRQLLPAAEYATFAATYSAHQAARQAEAASFSAAPAPSLLP